MNRERTEKFKTRVLAIDYLRMYKMGGADVVGDASAEGSSMRPGPKGKARGDVKATVFSCGRTKRVWEERVV
jgi:hypothetical protein